MGAQDIGRSLTDPARCSQLGAVHGSETASASQDKSLPAAADAFSPTPKKMQATCDACPRGCKLAPGSSGFCKARGNVDGQVAPTGYGRLTSIALDPVEKKPLACWKPGTFVLSAGSYGCNMRCPFCQNHEIAMAGADDVPWQEVSPEALVGHTARLRDQDRRVIGVALTYNEPLTCWEYVRDVGKLAHGEGLACVLVSNGQTTPGVLAQLAGLIDAANIDLKAPDQAGYDKLGGSFDAAWNTITTLSRDSSCHVEVTTLVVPGLNDADEDIEQMAASLAGLDPLMPYHLSRFFPRHRMADARPTPVATVYHAADVARRHLQRVFTGNC